MYGVVEVHVSDHEVDERVLSVQVVCGAGRVWFAVHTDMLVFAMA